MMKNFMLIAAAMLCSPISTAQAKSHTAHKAYAQHALIDLHDCAPYLYRDSYALITCALNLCTRIGLMPYGQASVLYHQAGYGYSSGYTITQQASNHSTITIHVDERRGDVYIDIYSAMRYDIDAVVGYAANYFQAHDYAFDAVLR